MRKKMKHGEIIIMAAGVKSAYAAAELLKENPQRYILVSSDRHIARCLQDIRDCLDGVKASCIGQYRRLGEMALGEINLAHIMPVDNIKKEVNELMVDLRKGRGKRKPIKVRFHDAAVGIPSEKGRPNIYELVRGANEAINFYGDNEFNHKVVRHLADLEKLSKMDWAKAKRIAGTKERRPLGSSNELMAVRQTIARFASVEDPVLILGPTGVGKDVFARTIHFISERTGAYVPVNCAVLGATSEIAPALLFGHVKGAFTGASQAGLGYFAAAEKGTLFLDEVGELPLNCQALLLRALDEDEGRIIPVGGVKEKAVDVRLVAATNRNLGKMVDEGTFREDLLYRLNTLTVRIPTLKKRMGDARSLVAHLKPGMVLDERDWAAIDSYDWPGNIRQFMSLLRRAEVLGHSVVEAVEEEMGQGAGVMVDGQFLPDDRDSAAVRPLDDVKAEYVRWALERCDGDVTKTAALLGVSENTVRKWTVEAE